MLRAGLLTRGADNTSQVFWLTPSGELVPHALGYPLQEFRKVV